MDLVTYIRKNELTKALNGEKFSQDYFESIEAEEFVEILFEAVGNTDTVNESSKNIIDCIRDVQNGADVDEGLIGGILGGIAGVAFGPKIGNAICNALGIQKGPLYDLLNSRLVTTAIALKLGLRA